MALYSPKTLINGTHVELKLIYGKFRPVSLADSKSKDSDLN